MSKLEQLIRELCPKGVEYKSLDEVATDVFRGSGITREQIRDEGTPCVRYGEIYTTYGVWFDRCVSHTDESLLSSKKYFEYGDILFAITGESVEDIAKSCAYIGNEKCLAGGDIVVLKHNQDPKYIAYALSTVDSQKQKSKGKVKSKVVHSSVPDIKAIKIPVPPLPVQREIVRILDQFTELEIELEIELEKREKQYEHYRSTLLEFEQPGETSRKTLGEIATIKTGSKPGDIMRDNAPFKHINAGTTPLGYVTSINCKGNVVTTPSRGSSIGFIGFQHHDFWLGALCYRIRSKGEDVVLNRYLFHYLACHRDLIASCKKDGAIPALNLSDLKNIAVTFPPLPVQHEIVRILDQFSTLCTNLTSGLPAEINARKKQYEYYREKLFTFQPITR